MSLDRKKVTTTELQDKNKSCDAPPLDFSFRNIKTLEELLTAIPRHGVRKEIAIQKEDSKEKKLSKEELGKELPKEEEVVQEVEKKVVKKPQEVTRLVPQNNINSLINTLVANANLKNISGKNNQDKNMQKKRAVKIKLQCVSLILGYNKLSSLVNLGNTLTQIMPTFSKLQWLDLSHNHLQALDYDFQQMPLLRTLYLHCNYLFDMNNLTVLSHLENLKTLTIHGNPLTTVPNFRIYLIEILQHLKKLDSVVISKKERDNSRVWAKVPHGKEAKYPIPKSYAKPPVEDLEKNDNQYT